MVRDDAGPQVSGLAPTRASRGWLADVLAVALALIGVLHLIWAFSSWPLPDRESYARAVVGVPVSDLPGTPETLGVVVLLFLATYLVLSARGRLPVIARGRVNRWGVIGVSAVLLIRGVGGFILSGAASLGLWQTTTPAEYLRNDLLWYSPLCLLLGAMAMTVVPGRPEARSATESDS